MEIKNTRKGISSGLMSLDEITGGWQDSNLIVIASRPSIGKTAFAMQIACVAAVDNNIPVAFFTLEMSAGQFWGRILLHKIYNTQNWDVSEKHLTRLSESPLYVDDTPGLKIDEFKTKAKELVQEKGVRLIIVDYLQLMCGPKELRGQRDEEVSFIVRTLKSTAKELNIPIIALAQMSRMSGRTSGGRPELCQLRELAGTIEEAADCVILVHRPDIICVSDNPEDGEDCIFIVAKNRNGKLGDVSARFNSDNLSFVLAEGHIKDPVEKNSVPISQINDRLNQKYTFSNIEINANNKDAVKAAKAFLDGKILNDQLLIVGPTGSGKTHLANAIGNEIKANNPELAVLYVSGDDFKNQYIEAVKTNRLYDFRTFYGKLDVLILDNLQDLVGEGTQNCFLHTIDHLNQCGKRMLFTLSRGLDELELSGVLGIRTVEHLRWGKIVEIGKLDK